MKKKAIPKENKVSTPRENIKVVLEHKGLVTLRQSNYKATGGEGSIYRVGDLVIKIFTDPQKVRRDGMVEKIRLLSTINDRMIVSPQGMVSEESGAPIGYYMAYVDGEPLARIFTNDFRVKAGFGDEQAKALVNGMRDVVICAHQHHAIIVDPNELNWFAILQSVPEPRIIDVDSWAIGRWPAKVIMPSIKDRHIKGFTELSDWFSWGVVTFQVFTGIHPYKGTLAGFNRSDLEGRMKANASVFSRGVGLNIAVRDFSCVPGPLLNWYQATFQKGERNIPPSPFDTGIGLPPAAMVYKQVITITGALVFQKIFSQVNDPVIRVWPCGVVLLKSGTLFDLGSKREVGKMTSRFGEVVHKSSGWVVADKEKNDFRFTFVRRSNYEAVELPLSIQGNELLRYEERLFVGRGEWLAELVLTEIGNKPILSVGQQWGIMENAVSWFDGVGVQDALGAIYLIVPFSNNACAHVRVKELDQLKPINAKAGHRFVTVIAVDKSGSYQKFEFSFDRGYTSYKLWQGTVDGPELNVSILPRGVCATVINDGELIIFVPSTGLINKVTDKKIRTDMILDRWNEGVVYIQNGEVWALSLKK